MSNTPRIHKHTKSARNKGLFIAIAAALVLILLAAYRIPLIHNEHHGVISAVSEIHNETGVTLIAIVTLDNGTRVLASMPQDLPIRTGVKTSVMERRPILGRKSYSIVSYNE